MIKNNETNNLEKKEHPKLYLLWSVIPRYEYFGRFYKDVHIVWYVEKREKPIMPYRDGIKDYPPSIYRYPRQEEMALDELFTETKVKVFEAYILNTHNDITLKIDEASLPYENYLYPQTRVPFGDGRGCIALYTEPDYCLGFMVRGIFNVSHLEAEEIRLEVGPNPFHYYSWYFPCLLCNSFSIVDSYCTCIAGRKDKHFVCDKCTKEIAPQIYEDVLKERTLFNESVYQEFLYYDFMRELKKEETDGRVG